MLVIVNRWTIHLLKIVGIIKSTLSGHKHDADRYYAYNLMIL